MADAFIQEASETILNFFHILIEALALLITLAQKNTDVILPLL